MVIYLSDNGFLYGEHRRTGKNDPWEESVKVPMVVRYPAALPATRSFASDALVQNVDLAPTILDAAGIPWGGDGQSFLPVIERKKHTVRTAALIEQCRGESRGIPDCSGYNFNGARTMTPGFEGVVTERYKYVEFEDGSSQLIDLKKDPHEFHDLSRNPGSAALKRQMAAKLHALMRPRLQTTIATGPSRVRVPRRGVLVLLAVPVRDLPMPLDPERQVRPVALVPGWVRRLQRSRRRAAIGSRSPASRRPAAIDRSPASRSFTLASSRSRRLARQPPGSDPWCRRRARSRTAARSQARSSSVAWSRSSTVVPWARATRPGATFCGLAEGSYRFDVRARDASDEVSHPAAGWFFRVDTTGPTVAFSSAPAAEHPQRLRVLPVRAGGVDRRLDDVHGGRQGGRLLERPDLVAARRASANTR